MKTRLLTLTAALLLAAMAMPAQVPQALSALFGGSLRDNPAATETVIKGEPLKPYSLSLFHSLEVTGDASLANALERAVKSDGSDAEWKETVVKGGRLQNGIYELPKKKHRRYVLYLNTFLSGGDAATVIYLEGDASPEKIRKLISTISR